MFEFPASFIVDTGMGGGRGGRIRAEKNKLGNAQAWNWNLRPRFR